MNTLQVNVQKNYSQVLQLTLPLSATVGGVKYEVSKKQKIEYDNQYLTYLGRLLKDNEKVTSLKPGSRRLQLRLVLKNQQCPKIVNIPKPERFHRLNEMVQTQNAWVFPQLQNLLTQEQNNVPQQQAIDARRNPEPHQREAAVRPEAGEIAQPVVDPQPAAREAVGHGANRFWNIFCGLNVFLIFRLVLFAYIIGRDEPDFQVILTIACVCYYLWCIGFVTWLRRKLRRFFRLNIPPGNGNNNAGGAGINNARRDEPVMLDRHLTRRELVERFFVGLFASLFPMWRPPIVRIREPQNQHVAPNQGVDAPNNRRRAHEEVADANNNRLENDGNVEHEHQD